MTILQDILAALNWQIRVTENFSAVSPAALFSKKHSTTTGLTLGYYGGILDGVSYADGTHVLTASTTRYVVAARATGVVSSSTGTTNWNDQTAYLRMGVAVVGASTITTWTDWRQSYGGSGGGIAGSDKQIQYNDGGIFGAEAGFEYDKTTNTLTVVNATFTGLASTTASATGGAGLRIPHGVAPTSPTNGDVWTTTGGLFARINGATEGPYATSAGSLTNPMTTVGDMIIGDTVAGGFATPARLAIGTNTTDVLGVAAGSPAWVKRTPLIIPIACSDETTALTTGTAKVTFRMPCAMTLTDVRASVTTAATGGTLLTVDVNESGTTILSTKLTFDASEKTTTTAATPRVISDSSLADDAEITIDIDAVGSTIAGAGLKVYLIGYPA
jgi:hypothetical protein